MCGVAGTPKTEPEHLVADGEIADPVPDLDDNSGQVAALTRGKRRGELLMQCADADSCLAGIDPGGANLDEHLACAGGWHIDIGHIQDIAPAISIEPDRARLCSCHADLPLLAPFLGAACRRKLNGPPASSRPGCDRRHRDPGSSAPPV
jgi:hypothetical protein